MSKKQVSKAKKSRTILVTGGAGFIGFHTIRRLLDEGHTVVSVDNLNEYYDVTLKEARCAILKKEKGYFFYKADILDYPFLQKIASEYAFDAIIHLAALAGVRYSLDHGIDYIRTNLEGTYNIFELARHFSIPKVIYASSSSVYGANGELPSSEDHKADSPVSLYAATKKSNELLAYTYSHLFKVNSIGLRFFTVYGPWGRPDMALFLFTKGIIGQYPIDVYNHGKMKRDFTYIEDIVDGIIRSVTYDTEYDIFNLGRGKQENLMDFIGHIELSTKKKAIINFMPMQAGDVKESLADIRRAGKYLGYVPKTSVAEGVGRFVDWYMDYYKVGLPNI